jgi:MATE family multidrug resistance protein
MSPKRPSLARIRVGLSRELPPMLRLATPVVAAELGWMTMGLVDLMFVGRLGAEALGGVSIGHTLFFAVTVFGIGMLLGLDYLISHAHGGGRPEDANRSLLHGVYLSLALSAVLMALILLAMPHLHLLGIEEAILAHARPYLFTLTVGMPLLLLFVALRRYLQAIGEVQPIMIALVSANLLNFAADYALVFGNWGFPALGVAGAGWATFASRLYLLLFAVLAIALREKRVTTGLWSTPRAVERVRMERMVKLGLPAALQVTLEVGVFSVATILAGRLGTLPLAAHQVALSIASFTFMVPLGVSSAGAVRVGQALGAGDTRRAARSGWTALVLGGGFMLMAAVVFALFPRPFVAAFTDDADVIRAGAALLGVAALFQLFDGLQITATGVLRGAGDTRRPMIVGVIGYWLIGLPVGYVLAFPMGGGVLGIWAGLCVGLMVVGVVLLRVWALKTREWRTHPAGT